MEGLDRRKSPLKKAITRASAAAFAGALATGPVLHAVSDAHSDRGQKIERLQKPRDLIREMLELEEKTLEMQRRLAPGGDYHAALSDESLNAVQLGAVMNDMSRLSARLTIALNSRLQMTHRLRELIVPDNDDALSLQRFKLRTGTDRVLRCNAGRVGYAGRAFLGTNQHCVEGTVDEQSFYTKKGGPDVAFRELDASKRDGALEFSEVLDDVGMIGKPAVFTGTDRFDRKEEFVSFLAPLTPQVYRMLFNGKPLAASVDATVRPSYWFVMPPRLTDRTGEDANFLGLSGTWIRVRDDVAKRHVIGASFHSGLVRSLQCADDREHVCTSIGFATRPSHIRALFDAYAARAQKTSGISRRNAKRRP